LGDRGVDGAGLDADYLLETRYLEEVNRETFLVVQIETPEAVANVDSIAAVPGVDGLFVGPGDLGLRLQHHTGELTLESCFDQVAAACKQHNTAWGTPVATPEILRQRQDQGGQLLAHGGEFRAIMNMLEKCGKAFESNRS